ncbi:hypothetical protein KDL01_36460 [Actinospica durhamensis]|uniref:Gram-positive cocci surface proteins LPxTG domain-containing protein n=1 Tax=Actinospica durhamensis TaxID=1508375 RepID=A0A941EYG8_9ACTN|nr:hypothetical protein [Actinospica durhamensis]MBR7838818.1 hypothetical protein [Actinospica durhamensis]
MLASRIAALTIATGALVAAAGPAFADYGSGSGTNPPPVAPGSYVWITDGFTKSFCPSTDSSAIAKSDGFKGAITLTRGGSFHGLAGKGFATDTPGSYGVSVTCASGKSSADFQTLVVSPKGAARTGDGASLLGGSANTTGLVLLGGAVAVGMVASRRKAKADR